MSLELHPEHVFFADLIAVGSLSAANVSNLVRTCAYCWEVRISERKLVLVQKHQLKKRETSEEEVEAQKTFLKHIKYSRFAIRHFFVVVVIQSLLMMILYSVSALVTSSKISTREFVLAPANDYETCGAPAAMEHYFAMAFFSAEIALNLYFLLRYGRSFEDNFRIRRELFWQTGVLVVLHTYIILSIFEAPLIGHLRHGEMDILGVVFIVLNIVSVWVTFCQPLMMSYSSEFARENIDPQNFIARRSNADVIGPTERTIHRRKEFVDFLADPEGFESFTVFMRNEFNLESLLFWKEVFKFRTTFPQIQDQRKEADRIYSTFINPETASMMVNLPWNITTNMTEKLSDPHLHQDYLKFLFAGAEEDVLQNMLDTSFFRFKQKSDFTSINDRVEFQTATQDIVELINRKFCCFQPTPSQFSLGERLVTAEDKQEL
jgi:hypothetical protein